MDHQGPIQLDRDVVYESRPTSGRVKKKRPRGIYILAAAGGLMAVALLLYQPEGSSFVEDPPPEEQAERDAVFEVAVEVERFVTERGSLPSPNDLDLPPGFIYAVEDEVSWYIETPGGLFYTSDMDPEEFRGGSL
ncbi:MAG TPA: hypothetical protein P5207_02835 [Candidatus Sabulitectum sp.]|nr:hypothetical protein [Candidatus Sabulitectum sp.]HRW77581.1 hypothetical protein [Candidatus Sabulitectum sp.]